MQVVKFTLSPFDPALPARLFFISALTPCLDYLGGVIGRGPTMYSLILMTALASAPEQQEFNGFFRRLFSFGGGNECYGSERRSSGCYGSSDKNSCYGSRVRAFNPDSCSCYGSSMAARSASCYGSASYSCFGAGASSLPNGEFATPSSTMSFSPPVFVNSPPIVVNNGPPMGSYVITNPLPDNSAELSTRRFSGDPLASSPNRAKVTIKVPVDAKLYAEGRPLVLTGSVREFVTPILPTNQEFQYTFRVEYQSDGETISRSKALLVRAGGSFTVEFTDLTQAKLPPKLIPDASSRPNPLPFAALPSADFPPLMSSGDGIKSVSVPTGEPTTKPLPKTAIPTGLSAERARITVKLAPGAVLYVDGKKNERKELVREFTTPPLTPGQEFAYQMRAETIRNGQPDVIQAKVSFRAGELVTVDFTTPIEKK
jgi:uncharacterized protein (TIGR03000 family)